MKIVPVSLLFCAVCIGTASIADNIVMPVGSSTYYNLNGGAAYAAPAVTTDQTITIGPQVSFNSGVGCTGFNPAVAVSNTINNLKDSIQGLSSNIISSATSAVTSLPMYELSHSNPKLYNLIQNGIFGAQQKYNVSMKSCQQAMSQINNGQSPYNDWFSFSKANAWKSQAKDKNADINSASDTVTQTGAQYGINWIHKGQKSGGTVGKQAPIKVLSDIALAGYNVLIDPHRALDDQSAPSPTTNPELTKYWKTPAEATAFAQTVLGDYTITSNQSQQSTVAGMGLVPMLTTCPETGSPLTCVKTIQDRMQKIVSSNGIAPNKDLLAVSSSNYLITPYLISKIRGLTNTSTQTFYVTRISQGVAIQNLVNEALMLRRLLIAGSQTQAVYNYEPALKLVTKSIDHLNKDIDNLLFESNIKKEMSGNIIQNLLANSSAQEQAIGSAKNHLTPNMPNVNNGAVYVNGDKKP